MRKLLLILGLLNSPALFAQTIINRDVEIESMVKEISPDSLHAFINTLTGFGTRHTLSSVKDKSRGIGAAREWVVQKFSEFAKNSGEIGRAHV